MKRAALVTLGFVVLSTSVASAQNQGRKTKVRRDAQASVDQSRRLIPENFFQAANGTVAISPFVRMISIPGSDLSTSGVKFGNIKMSSTAFGIGAEFGVGSLSLGAQVAYENQTTELTVSFPTNSTSSGKLDGLEDVEVFLKGYNPLGGMSLHYGLSALISPGPAKVANLSTNKDGNQYSGGHTLQPYVGMAFGIPTGFLGTKLQYTHRLERTSESQETTPVTRKTTGGHMTSLAAFYELHVDQFEADIGAQYMMLSSSETVSTTKSSSPGYNALGFQVGGQYQFTPNVNVRLQYQGMSVPEIEDGSTRMSPYLWSTFTGRLRLEF